MFTLFYVINLNKLLNHSFITFSLGPVHSVAKKAVMANLMPRLLVFPWLGFVSLFVIDYKSIMIIIPITSSDRMAYTKYSNPPFLHTSSARRHNSLNTKEISVI